MLHNTNHKMICQQKEKTDRCRFFLFVSEESYFKVILAPRRKTVSQTVLPKLFISLSS
jgi:hypothetical protein